MTNQNQCPVGCTPTADGGGGGGGGGGTTTQSNNCSANETTAKTALRNWYNQPNCTNEAVQRYRLPALKNQIDAFTEAARKAYDAEERQYNVLMENGRRLAAAAEGLIATKRALVQERDALKAEKTDATQMARRHRRAFQDGDPQSGVGGSPGVRTLDDRILIAFWVNMGAALTALVVAICWRYGLSTSSTVAYVAVTLLGAYVVAYYCITKWA